MGHKKILVLNYEFPPLGGGASPVSYGIAKGYAQKGHDVDVVTMGYRGLPSFEIRDGLHIYRMRCWRSKKNLSHPWEQLTYIWSAKRFLRKHLRSREYDINHTHFLLPTGLISLWLWKRYGLPYIVSIHGSDIPGYNTDRFVIMHKFTRPFLRRISDNAHALTSPSRYLAGLLKKNVGEYDIRVIPNGSKDYLDKTGIPKKDIIFTSGRLLRRKGIQYLIQAFKRIKNKNWELLILGDGPYRPALEKIARGNSNIHFTGWLDNDSREYIDIVNTAKIFCLLSKAESQGIVFLEAMSTGCAIVTADTTACTETVCPEVGLSVERDNIDDITEKLDRLIGDEEKLSHFMRNARAKYESTFRYEAIVQRYEELLP